MMKHKMNKKGIEVKVLISILIILLSAAIIFYFFKMLPYKETVDKEACHQSVLLRSQKIAGLKPGQLIGIPLNCKTQHMKVTSTNEQEIKREIANQMYDCWWMLGEGKKNFFGRLPTLGAYKGNCVICSIIDFDKNVKEKVPEIKDLNQYLMNTKIPQKNKTYWQYITNTEAPIVFKDENEKGPIKTNTKYAVVYALSDRSILNSILAGFTCGLIAAKGGAIAGGAIGSAVGTIIPVGGTVAGGAAGGAIGAGVGFFIGAAGCGFANEKIADFSDKNPGYYVSLDLLPLNAKALSDYGCQNIESIP